jgi:hypothetical protein
LDIHNILEQCRGGYLCPPHNAASEWSKILTLAYPVAKKNISNSGLHYEHVKC